MNHLISMTKQSITKHNILEECLAKRTSQMENSLNPNWLINLSKTPGPLDNVWIFHLLLPYICNYMRWRENKGGTERNREWKKWHFFKCIPSIKCVTNPTKHTAQLILSAFQMTNHIKLGLNDLIIYRK